ncbi:MAG TPA: TIR domain-containing protein [Bacteroidia bacterium]|nr:TIR domain-containing protein [Bacteroidia bacterium]
MPETIKEQKIFLSYSWKNKEIVNELDADFINLGITFTRDVRDAQYRTSLKEFMSKINDSDYVVMLISDEYLRSENCMHEVTELLNTQEFEKRILPLVHENASNIFDNKTRGIYYDYWKQKCQDALKQANRHFNDDSIEVINHLYGIYKHLDIFFQKIKDLNSKNLIELKKDGYKPLLKIMNIENLPQLLTEKEKIEKRKKEKFSSLRLTGREIEIFKLMIIGLPSKIIADQLLISEETVKSHRKSVLMKFGLNSTAGLINYAVQNGLTE